MVRQDIDELVREEATGGRERRRSRRFGCEGFAEGFAIETGTVFRGEIRSISKTGCYVKTRARLKLEQLTEVDLLFTLKKRKYRTLARVISVRPGKGVGLEFVFYDPQGGDLLNDDLVVLAEEGLPEEA